MSRRVRLRSLLLALAAPLLAQETPQPNRIPWLAIFPEPLPSGERGLTLEFASMFLRPDLERSADGRTFVRIDGEEWHLLWDHAMDLGPGRLSIRLHVLDRAGGFMDQAIQTWHALLGVPNGGRELAPKHRLAYHLERDGVTLAHLDRNGAHLADTNLAWVQTRGDRDRGWRWGAALKLPTGRRADFSGSGGWDALVGVAGWTRLGALDLHGQAEHVVLGLPADSPYRAALDRRSFQRAWAGAGIRGGGPGFWRGLGLDLTLAYSSTPYALGIPRMDRHGLEQHWTVTHRALPRWRFTVSEEAETYTAPDIKVAATCRF